MARGCGQAMLRCWRSPIRSQGSVRRFGQDVGSFQTGCSEEVARKFPHGVGRFRRASKTGRESSLVLASMGEQTSCSASAARRGTRCGMISGFLICFRRWRSPCAAGTSASRLGCSRPRSLGRRPKYTARVRQVASMPLHRPKRLVMYMRFVAQVAPMTHAALTGEQAAIAPLFRCPMHALGPGILPFLSCMGGDVAIPSDSNTACGHP